MENYKPAIKNGLILGIIGILIHVVIYAINPDWFLSKGYGIISMVLYGTALPIVLMVLAARDCKPNFDSFKFGKAFQSAVLVGVLSVALSITYSLIFNNLIDTQFEEWMYNTKMEQQMDVLENRGYDEATIEKIADQSNAMKKYTTGVFGVLIMHGIFLFWYAILALIVGAVQKEKKTEDLLE